MCCAARGCWGVHSFVGCSMNRVEDCTPLIFSVSTSSCLLRVRLQVADGCCSLSRADDGRRLQVADGCCSLSRADDGRRLHVAGGCCSLSRAEGETPLSLSVFSCCLLLQPDVFWRTSSLVLGRRCVCNMSAILIVLFVIAVCLVFAAVLVLVVLRVFSASFFPGCLGWCSVSVSGDQLCLTSRSLHPV